MVNRALHLSTPDSTIAALSVCETSAAALAEWVAQLPMAHTPEAAQQLHKVATEIARLNIDPDTRFNYLEIIREPAHYICTRLDRTAAGGSNSGEGLAQLAQLLQYELATGYKVVIKGALEAADTTGPTRELVGHAIHRGLADLSIAMRRTFEFYADAPRGAWSELNRLYGLAEEFDITQVAYADDQTRGAAALTIADVYLRIAMLAGANPNQLRPKDLSATYQALEQWTSRLGIGSVSDETVFVVALDADAPPQYRELGGLSGDLKRGIRTDLLVYELEAYLTQMPSDVPVPDYVSPDLLQHLVRAWGAMKKRSFRRSQSAGVMKICIGLRTLHYYISGGIDFADQLGTTEALLRREINPFVEDPGHPLVQTTPVKAADVWDAARIPENPNIEDPARILFNSRQSAARHPVEASYPCYDTEIIDTSPAGYCVRWHSAPPPHLQTGELLAVRERDDARWCIAVSRWIRHGEKGTLLGLELLAPRAIPAAVRLLQKRGSTTEYNRAVLLPALEAIGQPAMLITPRLPYHESQKVQIRRHGIQATGQLMRRVRMSESFTQFTFRMLDGYLESTQIDLNMGPLSDTAEADRAAQRSKGPSTGPAKGQK